MGKWSKRSGEIPYRDLKSENLGKAEIISMKERELRRFEHTLTILLAGALLICILLITYLSVIMAQAQNETSPFGNTMFATNLYNVLKSTPGNLFFSPYSLQVAIAMAYAGASGNTAKEMQKSFMFPENKEVLYKDVQASSGALKSTKDVILDMANGLFVQKDYSIKEAFVKNMKGVFGAEAKQLNFGNSSEAASEINSFVNTNTRGKIPELFESDAFTDLTRLVLVNAVYFKGAWMNPFDVNDTFKGDFHLNSKDKVQVDFMTITKKFNAAENDALNANIVELPYQGDYSMVLIVPKEIEGIKQLENKIKDVDLKAITDQTTSREVHLTMPKFKLEQTHELANTLKALGVKDMFEIDKADFGEVSDRRDLYVSKVVQKAFIEVNEEGSEAAAATGIMLATFSMPARPIELVVNRPFLFYIMHLPSDTPLFFGRVSKFN